MLFSRCSMDGVGALGDESSSVFEGLDGGSVLVHEIDLFQRKTFGLRERSVSNLDEHYGEKTNLGNAQEGEDDAAEASRAPDKEHL